MHKFLIIAAAALSLTACTSTQQGATVGALGGAVVGAAAGDVLGRVKGSPDRCIYRDRNGREYVDYCPKG